MNKLKPSLAALGLSTALAVGSAAASITWNPDGTTLFEDDDIDFVWELIDPNDPDAGIQPDSNNFLDVGDILISVLEFTDANGGTLLPEELTGLAAGQITSITPIFGTLGIVEFGAYDGGLNAILALGSTDETVPGGEAGGGALIAMWEDPSPNLEIAADNITNGTVSCTSLSQCIDQAVDGELWQVDGFTGVDGAPVGDEIWVTGVAELNTLIPLNTEPSIELSSFNAAASILFNGTGQDLVFNSISCFPFCYNGLIPFDDGHTDVIAGGSVKGGAGLTAGLISDGAVASSDFDLQKRIAVPEPSTLALLAAGFLGVGAAKRRRRKA